MYTLADLPYDYSSLEPFIDEETMRIHHDKHHASYVSNLNKALEKYPDFAKNSVEDLLKKLQDVPEDIQTTVRNNAGGHANHTFFWESLKLNNGALPHGMLSEMITTTFQSFNEFKNAFSTAAMGRFGSGWAWLILDGEKLEITSTANQDSPITDGKTPLLGLDVWEHAYYLKYQNKRQEYVDAFWNIINWDVIESRLAAQQG